MLLLPEREGLTRLGPERSWFEGEILPADDDSNRDGEVLVSVEETRGVVLLVSGASHDDACEAVDAGVFEETRGTLGPRDGPVVSRLEESSPGLERLPLAAVAELSRWEEAVVLGVERRLGWERELAAVLPAPSLAWRRDMAWGVRLAERSERD